jgi:hypothetical protein
VDVAGGRGPIEQARLALGLIAGNPLAGGRLAHLGGLGRLGERLISFDQSVNEEPALVQTERGVSVELHPVSSLRLGGVDTPSLQGGPDETTGSGITTRLRARDT